MCDTEKHETGWKVMRTSQWREWVFALGEYQSRTTLYLRCRTEHCIETRLKVVKGYWNKADFPGMIYKDGVGK